MTEILNVLTPKERERKERNEAICREFQELNPKLVEQGFKPYRTITVLAKKYEMTPAGIRFVLNQAGVFTTSEDEMEKLAAEEKEAQV